jgi:hypothetical protein
VYPVVQVRLGQSRSQLHPPDVELYTAWCPAVHFMTGQASGGHIGSQAHVFESKALPAPQTMPGQVAWMDLSRGRLEAEIILQPQVLKTWLKIGTAGGVQEKFVQYESGFTWPRAFSERCKAFFQIVRYGIHVPVMGLGFGRPSISPLSPTVRRNETAGHLIFGRSFN